jgi:DnaK suppressor protein
MTRQSVLLRLHKDLLARRDGLCKKLAGGFSYLRDFRAVYSTGDSADLAFEADSDEMSSRLVELDDRELSKIERALAHWQGGTFGACESCQKRIPLARLKALPFTAFCINCERELEKTPDGQARQSTDHWSRIPDRQTPMQDQRIDLSEVERDLSRSGRD